MPHHVWISRTPTASTTVRGRLLALDSWTHTHPPLQRLAYRHVSVALYAVAPHALCLPQAAVQLDHPPAACRGVEPLNVLNAKRKGM